MHLGQLSTNDSWSPRVSEHDGEERMDLSSSVLELYFREGGHVLAKIAGYTLKFNFGIKGVPGNFGQNMPSFSDIYLKNR